MAPAREISSFECAVCDATLETWNTAWVPTYRFLAGPVRMPGIGRPVWPPPQSLHGPRERKTGTK